MPEEAFENRCRGLETSRPWIFRGRRSRETRHRLALYPSLVRLPCPQRYDENVVEWRNS